MDKNILIAEALYRIFVHHKCLGLNYRTGSLKKDLKASFNAVKLLYKNELTKADVGQIREILDICANYMSSVYAVPPPDKITGCAVEVREPADKMCELIGAIMSEFGIMIRSRRRISYYLKALHNLPLAYVSDNVKYLGEHAPRLRPDTAIQYCEEWLEKLW